MVFEHKLTLKKMRQLKFGELFSYLKKSKIKAGDGLEIAQGKYPFFTSSSRLTKSINIWQEEKPSLIFGTGGEASVHHADDKFSVSTDCLVAQPNEEYELYVKFVYYYLSGNIRILEDGFKGAGLKHISRRYIDEIKIPLPPLETQKQIAQTLDDAAVLRDKTQQLLNEYDQLAQSIFLEMFGDPVTNPKGWEKSQTINYAKCIVPGRDKPKSFTGETPWVTTNDLNHLNYTHNSKNEIGLNKEEISKVRAKVIPSGSVIITCVGDLGIASVNSRDIVVNQQLHTFQCSDKLNNIFLMFNLSFQKYYMYKMASSTTVPYMNKTIANSIPTIVPPIHLQNQFADKIALIEQQKDLAKQELQESDDLFQALLQKAFKGELV